MNKSESKAFLKMKRKIAREAARACHAFIDAARAVFPASEHGLISICYWAGFYCIRLPDKVMVIERGEVMLYIDWLPEYAATRAARQDKVVNLRQRSVIPQSPFSATETAQDGAEQIAA